MLWRFLKARLCFPNAPNVNLWNLQCTVSLLGVRFHNTSLGERNQSETNHVKKTAAPTNPPCCFPGTAGARWARFSHKHWSSYTGAQTMNPVSLTQLYQKHEDDTTHTFVQCGKTRVLLLGLRPLGVNLFTHIHTHRGFVLHHSSHSTLIPQGQCLTLVLGSLGHTL